MSIPEMYLSNAVLYLKRNLNIILPKEIKENLISLNTIVGIAETNYNMMCKYFNQFDKTFKLSKHIK